MARAEVEAAWLGDPLGAEVASVGVTPIAAFNSRTVRLTVRYAERSPSAIDRLVLKRNDHAEWAEWAVRAGRLEAAFHLLAGSLDPAPPGILRCLAAGTDDDTGDSLVLLPDLSATHAPPVTRDQQVGVVDSVPAPRDLDACVTALAHHHAYWWCHPPDRRSLRAWTVGRRRPRRASRAGRPTVAACRPARGGGHGP